MHACMHRTSSHAIMLVFKVVVYNSWWCLVTSLVPQPPSLFFCMQHWKAEEGLGMRLLGHCKTWCPTVKQIDVKHVDSLLLLFVNLLTYMYNTVCPGLSVFCWSILTVCSRATYIDRLEVLPPSSFFPGLQIHSCVRNIIVQISRASLSRTLGPYYSYKQVDHIISVSGKLQ